MLFQSVIFLSFFSVLLLFLRVVKNSKIQKSAVLLFSLYAYSQFSMLLALTISMSALACFILSKGEFKKWKLAISIIFQIGIFTYFKLNSNFTETNALVVFGVSFFTMQAIAYSVDVYKKKLPPQTILNVFLYLTYYPQLVAGPIIRPKNFFSQITSPFMVNRNTIAEGFSYLSIGLFLKLVISNNIAPAVVSRMSFDGESYNIVFWLINFTQFAIYIYADFAGYSLMAIGLAKSMGIDLPTNFNFPFIAKSFSEYWQRWHISLTEFFRDYIFFPTWSKKPNYIVAITLTFVVSGLWHGLESIFILWGIVHALLLIFERYTNVTKLPTFLRLPFTQFFVILTLGLFGCNSKEQFYEILTNPNISQSVLAYFGKFELFFIPIFFGAHYIFSTSRFKDTVNSNKFNSKYLLVTSAWIAILFFRGAGKQYAYFNF